MDDLITFACPACGAQMRAPWAAAGRPGRCAKCQKEFIVPAQFAMDDAAPPKPKGPAGAPGAGPATVVNPFQRTPPPPKPKPGPMDLIRPWLPLAIGAVVLGVGGWVAYAYFFAPEKPDAVVAEKRQAADGQAAAQGQTTGTTPDKAAASPAPTAIAAAPAPQLDASQELDRQKAALAQTKGVPPVATTSAPPLVPVSVGTPAPAASPSATPTAAGPRSAAELLAQLGPGVVTVSVTTDAGTNPVGLGVILFNPQYIVTPYHLVKNTKQVLVDYFRNSTSGEHSHQSATVIAVDRDHDLALLSSSNPYHAKPLVLGDAARAGTEVVAIINPKLTSAAGPQTTLAGSIGTSAQKSDAAQVMQTNLIIPVASQGSPVLAMDGTVVGLVTGRPGTTEPGGVAVPALFADRLNQGRDDKFAIGGDFQLWEMELPFTDLKNASGAVPISGLASHMVYDAEHGQLVMLIPARNKVLFLTTKDNVVAKELFTGTDPVDLKMSLTSKNLAWVANNTSKNIVSINLTTRVVEKTLTLTNAPLAMTLVRDSIWFMNATGTACVVKYSGGEDQEAPLSIRSLAYNGQRNNILMGSRNSWLCEVDGDHIQSLIQRQRVLRAEIDDYNKNAKFASKTSADARYDELTAEMRTLEAAIAKCDKVYNQPAGVATDFTTTQQSLFIDPPRGRVYFNRAVMDSKAPDKIIGVFKSPEHSMRNSEHLRELFAKYTFINQIIAVSPDGGVAASGTHLFNTEDFTVLRELPVPTTAIAFAPDMRTLYFCDVVNNQIVSMRYRDDSWTPPVADPKKAK